MGFIVSSDINFLNKKVLDLGCGVGIIGIHCLLNGAEVYFQDYVSILKVCTFKYLDSLF